MSEFMAQTCFPRHSTSVIKICSYLSQVYQEYHLWNQQAGQTTGHSGQGSGGLRLKVPVLSQSVPDILQAIRSGWRPSQETEDSSHVNCEIHSLSDENAESVRQCRLQRPVNCLPASNSSYLLLKRKYWSLSQGLCHQVKFHQ